MIQDSNDDAADLVPLRTWIEDEARRRNSARNAADSEGSGRDGEWILRKATVAFGIAELLRHSRDRCPAPPSAVCRIDNFAVRIGEGTAAAHGITGVDMLSPQLSLNIVEPSYLRGSLFDGGGDGEEGGRYLEVELPALPDANGAASAVLPDTSGAAPAVGRVEDDARCRSLGALLYELFSHSSPPYAAIVSSEGEGDNLGSEPKSDETSQGPAREKPRPLDSIEAQLPSFEQEMEEGQEVPQSAVGTSHFALTQLGFPSSLSMIVQNLLECGGADDDRRGDTYDSLETVSKDLHLLLLGPRRFLFNQEPAPGDGTAQLLFRDHILYGREHEVSLITDAFCRVSTGKSEALFIGGFSGVGKSRLISSLVARFDMSGAYVLTLNFGDVSKSKQDPLLGVISVFNDLCLLIKKKRSQEEVSTISRELMECFGADFSLLARLLPNIKAISPQRSGTNDEKECGNRMNLRSICFALKRFMGVVSSTSHLVVFFCDDLQCCDDSALALLENILCGVSRSGCLLFVGSYASNQVQEDHGIFRLMESLSSSGTPSAKLSLEGLAPEDVNAMVSDALCLFPRITQTLTDIVFRKTMGNPFFVLEFFRSLVDGALLEYSVQKRRWVWDEGRISSMDVTGNVLYLLSRKMSDGLSEKVQLALKVAACFGTKVKESIVGYLSSNPDYSNIQSAMEHAVAEGFVTKETSDFVFVHEKIREAAYRLIPDSEKNQYHYSLGLALYSMTKGGDVEDAIIFSMTDQVNYGIHSSLVQSPELRLDFAKLNEIAGVKAMECSDFAAAGSYLNTALSLLPNRWENHYDESRRLCLLLAKSACSCGDTEKAQGILQEILGECHCFKDKLPSYFLLVTILNACGENKDAFSICHDILSQLYETIPESLEPKQIANLITATSKKCFSWGKTSETDLLEIKEMSKDLSIALKFYSLMATVALYSRPEMFAFLVCRMTQLSMNHGLCAYSLRGFIQYAAVWSNKSEEDIPRASQMAKAAMSCFKKRFRSARQLPQINFCFYGLVAFQTESLQSCADILRQAFDDSMSMGETGTAFMNAIQHIKMSLIAGERLSILLDRVDHYLDLADLYKHDLGKAYISPLRDTISLLIDKGESTSSKSSSNTATTEIAMETMYFHRALQAFWTGYSERCQHLIGKMLQVSSVAERLGNIMITFYHGMNSLQLLKRSNTAKLRQIPKNAIATFKALASSSRWNFSNKLHLLEAESYSFQGNHEEAKVSYAAAITSARCSRFVHEQGLACEMAGFHYKRMGEHKSAQDFFGQAKRCYEKWGSQMKAESIARQLETIQNVLPDKSQSLG